MDQDITAILDGIKQSVEAVGRSGREEIHLDNIFFRTDASSLNVPLDSNLLKSREDLEILLDAFDISYYDLETSNIFTNDTEVESGVVAFLTQPAELGPNGLRIDMTVAISAADVTNELPQTVLTSQLFLRALAEQLEVSPGSVTFNVAYAYVLWDDAEQLVEFEIEIPR